MTRKNLRPKLLYYVIEKNREHERKYSYEPYWFHLYRVARMSEEYTEYGYEIGLLHDIVEDGFVTIGQLSNDLEEFGYTLNDIFIIVNAVDDLTNKFTKNNDFTVRRERKLLESERLSLVPPASQTVKYCDIIDNIHNIVNYDPKFAEVYIPEKKFTLKVMNGGHPVLYTLALDVVEIAERELKIMSDVAED